MNLFKSTWDDHALHCLRGLGQDWVALATKSLSRVQVKHPKHGCIELTQMIDRNGQPMNSWYCKHINKNNEHFMIFTEHDADRAAKRYAKYIKDVNDGVIRKNYPYFEELQKTFRRWRAHFKNKYHAKLPVGTTIRGRRKVLINGKQVWRSVKSGLMQDNQGQAISVRSQNFRSDTGQDGQKQQ